MLTNRMKLWKLIILLLAQGIFDYFTHQDSKELLSRKSKNDFLQFGFSLCFIIFYTFP